MSGPIIQNFSVPANDDVKLNFTLTPLSGASIGPGAQIFFNVYEQEFGNVEPGVPPVIVKVLDHGIEVTDPNAKKFTVQLLKTDTVNLLRNYGYEVLVIDVDGNQVRTTVGILTITATEIRP